MYIILFLREILKDDSGGAERNLNIILRILNPVENLFYVAFFHAEVVGVTYGTLQEYSDRIRKTL
jgi:hypothetical protein